MCLQAPGLGMCPSASAAAARLYVLVLQDLSSPLLQPFSRIVAVLYDQRSKVPAPVDLSSVIWVL